MGNSGLLCVRGRRNAYSISIGMSEGKSEDPLGKLRCGSEVSITMDLTDNGMWRCALDLAGLRWSLLTGCYKLCNLLFFYGGREFLSQLSKLYIKRNYTSWNNSSFLGCDVLL
jgi:hypothetical protein